MTKQEAMNEAAEAELYRLEGVVLTRSVIRDVFLNGWLAAEAAAMERPLMVLDLDFQAEIRDALGTLGEGMAATMQGIKSLQEAGLRGADRGVAVLKHLQEVGDNVRGVSGALGDKFGVVLDAVKDVGEKVEACMAIANNTEEGLAVSIEKLDKLGVEKWREAIKHVEAEGITEPMHAEVKAMEAAMAPPAHTFRNKEGQVYRVLDEPVKAADYDESGLGKLWADVPVNLEDVSDETLKDLATTEQITEARYWEERDRRDGLMRSAKAERFAYAALRAIDAPASGRYLDAARVAVMKAMDGLTSPERGA